MRSCNDLSVEGIAILALLFRRHCRRIVWLLYLDLISAPLALGQGGRSNKPAFGVINDMLNPVLLPTATGTDHLLIALTISNVFPVRVLVRFMPGFSISIARAYSRLIAVVGRGVLPLSKLMANRAKSYMAATRAFTALLARAFSHILQVTQGMLFPQSFYVRAKLATYNLHA